MSLANTIVQDQDISGIFIEMGSGPCVQYTLSQIPGASGTLVEGRFPNSKESQELIGKGENVRSVSLEAVRGILQHTAKNSPETPTIFVSSWQIPSGEKPVETHGWIGVHQDGKERFFHLTLTSLVQNTRARAQEIVAEAGLAILAAKGGKIDGFYGIDIAYGHGDKEDNSALEQYSHLPDFFPEDEADLLLAGTEHIVGFDENGKGMRAVEFLRSKKSLCLFKGSFNPVTIGHLKMAQIYEEQTGEKPVFAISVNTVDKWLSGAEDLRKRIKLITNLGYSVLVFRHGKFVENIETLKNLGFTGKKAFLCGADTKTRLAASDIKTLEETDTTIYAMSRIGHAAGPQNPVFHDLEWNPIDCSSTRIRNREEGWEKLMPEANLGLYRELYEAKETSIA